MNNLKFPDFPIRSICLWIFLLCGVPGLQACGGGKGAAAQGATTTTSATTTTTTSTTTTTVATSADNCLVVPPIAAGTGTTRSVAEFGAAPNDAVDDTAAIQSALDALKTGQKLVFPAGRYLTNKMLTLRVAGTTVDGTGATLHATNPDSQTLAITADDITVHSFTLTAVTDIRRSAPRHTRIAVWFENPDGSAKVIRRSVIRDNTIINAGAPGTPEANGASSGGIFLFHAEDFLVANNTVVRTLADAIHITAGSRNGRVIGNTVRENGDDMIAVVSYGNKGVVALDSATAMQNEWAARAERGLNRNILIARNNVSGQYWGRGITVVGGASVTIRNNILDNIPYAAAILISRESENATFGVNDVLIQGNTISNVQNRLPPYDFGGKFASHSPTGHGVIEMHASLFDDEAAIAQLKTELSIRNIAVVGNVVQTTAVAGLRGGVAINGTIQAQNSGGFTVSRSFKTAAFQGVTVRDNQFNGVPTNPMQIVTAGMPAGLHCSGNLRDGAAYTHAACVPTAPTVVGSTLACTAAGIVK